MTEFSIEDITKSGTKNLNKVYKYRNRTIAVAFFKNPEELKERWHNSQIELGAQYQYDGENPIWDYYLALCLKTKENSLPDELRFPIENDRFCCRKVLVFNQSVENFSKEDLIDYLFPKIQAIEGISFLNPDDFVYKFHSSHLLNADFFIRPLESEELDTLARLLTMEKSK